MCDYMIMSEFLTTNDLAERWGVHPVTVRKWKKRGTGPKWVKIGGKVMYPIDKVKEMETAQ
jgi:uncharacterized protein YjcR